MVEVRADELRFTPDEAAAFLSQTMGLTLAPEQVAALAERAEGWIAGLQMAALSMRGREDVDAFIQAFAGTNRFILDFLVEEVLAREPEEVQAFLLQTAILTRLSGPLCDAVTGVRTASRCSSGWSGATSLSCPWTTIGAGIAIIISLPTCCRPASISRGTSRSPSSWRAPLSGASGTARWPKR